jgi:hypothetical protein
MVALEDHGSHSMGAEEPVKIIEGLSWFRKLKVLFWADPTLFQPDWGWQGSPQGMAGRKGGRTCPCVVTSSLSARCSHEPLRILHIPKGKPLSKIALF